MTESLKLAPFEALLGMKVLQEVTIHDHLGNTLATATITFLKGRE